MGRRLAWLLRLHTTIAFVLFVVMYQHDIRALTGGCGLQQ
jgi:hypothetical protein